MASKLVSLALVVVACAMPATSWADPSAAEKETARSLMNEGRTARDKRDLQAALKAFTAADTIMHVPTTGLEIARTQVALGLLVEARDTALRVSRIPEKPGEPNPFKVARDAAITLNDDLATRIPSLIVNVKNVPEGTIAEVTLDQADLPVELLGQPRKLDPGHHVVVAKAGTVDGKQEIDLAEKDQKTITIELPAQPAVAPPVAHVVPDSTPEPVTGKSGFSKGLMIGGFAVGGAALATAIVTGLVSSSKTSSIKSSRACSNDVCGPTEFGDISTARSMATVSTVTVIVAGVGAALGVVGLVTGNSHEASPSSAPAEHPADDEKSSRVEPWIGLGAAGLRGSF